MLEATTNGCQRIPQEQEKWKSCKNNNGGDSQNAIISNKEQKASRNRSKSLMCNLEMAKRHPSTKEVYYKTDKLSVQMEKLYKDFAENLERLKKKKEIRKSLYDYLHVELRHVDLYIVGSSLCNYASNLSDVDICLVFRNQNLNRNATLQYLHIIGTLLSKSTDFSGIQLIAAKVPLLKITDKKSKIEIDMNLNKVVSIHNTRLVKSYTRLDDRVSQLVLLVKYWARKNEINNAFERSLSSYTLTLMVINYLQCACKPIVLPCLQKICKEEFDPRISLDEINLYANLPTFRSCNKESISELFLGFLNHYSKFDFQELTISVRLGYWFKTDHRKHIFVEEPFDHSNTATSVSTEYAFQRIKDTFLFSYEQLNMLSVQIKRLFNDYVQSEHDLNLKKYLRKELFTYLNRIFNNHIDIYLVGSSLCGYASKFSDANICMVHSGHELSNEAKHKCLNIVTNALIKTNAFSDIKIIDSENACLRMTHLLSNIDIEMKVNNKVRIHNTRLIKSYTRLDDRVSILIFLVLFWAKQNDIHGESKGLNSYTLVLMMITYLQRVCNPIVLPCLQELCSNEFNPDIGIDEINLFANLPEFRSTNRNSLSELFIGFLKHYSDFCFRKYTISVRNGDFMRSVHRAFINVEEPFEISNTASSLSSDIAFEKMRQIFVVSYRTLMDNEMLSSILPLR
ncbi:poly(A) RNA polymerase GLD2-like protein [Leptotrombidium deliense]|uniref:Poly(A) RNA polymerase GLD2-like protein n=1 Tax=Leptotrombidium deliense TaxID=299467 RepID=A0A443SPR5_9ACAR|nr:poly(A) RNA polymerase GLD2-like protein [Leptotrombidium deliense]